VLKKFFDRIERDEFLEKAREFSDYDHDSLDRIGKALLCMGSNHPMTFRRASEILEWVESGTYSEVIERRTSEKLETAFKCPECGTTLSGDENFCGMCGSKLWCR